ncbi:MAG TPA: cation:proton antiporter [Gemmatimonadota bacterium]|nr:cation:proton antiporter [Gemmatimonadota bacterium]
MTAIVIAVGILAQVLADRVRLPSIVFLLIFGVLVGPDVLGIVDPREFGAGLRAIVTIAVAVILFEGGLQLRLVDVAAVGNSVRNLVTVGVAVTVACAGVTAHYLVGMPWSVAFLFGAIVSVTGPTVIQPLLDRVRVKRRVDTVLRGEGILIDPVGAILAVVVLELIVTADASVWTGLLEFAKRMAAGAAVGLAGGWLLGRLLRARRLFPEELKNLVVLAWVIALFAAADAIAGEAGLAAVVLAGMAVGRESIPRHHQLRRFKSELSVLFISILFILLSAFLRLETLASVGWSGVAVVAVLMLVVRPLGILLSTWRSALTWRERLFLMWISPRGVVAISLASFIALQIGEGAPEFVEAGLTPADGDALLALVFLTIAITVLVQGLTADPISRLLGVHAESSHRAVIVGANEIARALGSRLLHYDWEPVLVDSNSVRTSLARRRGLATVTGNAVDRSTLEEAGVADAAALIGVTPNQEINFLAARLAVDEYHVPAVYPLLVALEEGAHEELVEDMGGHLAFGRRIDVARWNYDLRHGKAVLKVIELGPDAPRGPIQALGLPDEVVPILVVDGRDAVIARAGLVVGPGQRIEVFVRQGVDLDPFGTVEAVDKAAVAV